MDRFDHFVSVMHEAGLDFRRLFGTGWSCSGSRISLTCLPFSLHSTTLLIAGRNYIQHYIQVIDISRL